MASSSAFVAALPWPFGGRDKGAAAARARKKEAAYAGGRRPLYVKYRITDYGNLSCPASKKYARCRYDRRQFEDVAELGDELGGGGVSGVGGGDVEPQTTKSGKEKDVQVWKPSTSSATLLLGGCTTTDSDGSTKTKNGAGACYVRCSPSCTCTTTRDGRQVGCDVSNPRPASPE